MSTVSKQGFVVKPISSLIGSVIHGLNLAKPIPAQTLKKLRAVWLDRKVLVFPVQTLTPQQ
ncbi:MAG: hypothetical protein COB26_09695 [Piscirickettsiaceae bacterium]|nr:MAG: hypothetical protein COB26_09695 [Piscirickettsiaceae bacterium]